jgi:hypothetical protein
LDYFDALSSKYESVLTKLDVINEKLDHKSPLAVMVESLSHAVSSFGKKLSALKDSIVAFAKNTLEAAKDKSLSALGAVSGTLHIHEGLEAISKGLNRAAVRCENLEQFHQERIEAKKAAETVATEETQPPVIVPVITLAVLLADTRVDFENLSKDELKSVYENLLAIGMDNDLTANENVCLQGLIEEITELLPEYKSFEPTQELETEADVGEEI